MTPSLRSRLLLRTTVALALLLAVTGATTYALVRAALVSEFDRVLTAEADALMSLTEQEGQRVSIELESDPIPRGPGIEGTHYFQLWAADGSTIARSRALGEIDLPRRVSSILTEFAPVVLPDGIRGRAAYVTFVPRDDEDVPSAPAQVTLAVARATRGLERTLARLAWLLAGVGFVAVVSSAGLMAWAIVRGLRPLGTLAKSIEKVGVGDLNERIEPGDAPAELIPIVLRLNELIARLADAVSREKAFTADVAHELRTPLAGLETVLEVCASRPRESSVYADVVRKCLRAARGMHAMVDTLLLLARADARQLRIEPQRVELEPFVHESWQAHRTAQTHAEIRVTPANAAVVIDRGKLLMVLNNLFDNAVTYADGGAIKISADARDNQLRLAVVNEAHGLVASDVEHVFDRFWRKDAARSDVGVHCGLGLSLCRRLVEIMGGTITARAENEAFTVDLVIPARPAPELRPAASSPVGLPVPAGS